MNWPTEALWEQLEPWLPGLSVEVLARCESTNTELLNRAKAWGSSELAQVRRSRESAAFGANNPIEPCLLVAEHQTQGRGRMGRQWLAQPNASLTFSLSLTMLSSDLSGLSLAVGVALADALEPAFAQGHPRIGLKWPNDLWLMECPLSAPPQGQNRGKKLGGVLIETCVVNGQRVTVVGVGLNVLTVSQDYACLDEAWPSSPAFNAAQRSPSGHFLSQTAPALVQALLAFDRHGFSSAAERFAKRDILRNHQVITTQSDTPQGLAQGISPRGGLWVKVPTGELKEITSGEVSVLHALF
jgi:BirA family transcriptional regulator, biotin operon repressor / biotin---[acetyl-CoA-carboxylase] ligase